jgi:tetratricopeptide (TPR) repeat protein
MIAAGCALSITAFTRGARGETHEVRTPHFTVVTDAGPVIGNTVAARLESIRALLEEVFPSENVSQKPVVVYAVSDTQAMALLLPALWEDENTRKPDGLFREGPEKDTIVVRLDAPSEGPYATVYHEYFHVFARARFGRLPLWLDEGLAKFWEMTSIDSERVRIGRLSRRNLKILADEPSLPLPILFAVDHGSPHYEDTEQSAVFYAQSWALVHFLLLGDDTGERRRELFQYLRASGEREQPFGDLEALSRDINAYLQRRRFAAIERPLPGNVPVDEIRTRLLSEAEALAFRGDFLAHGETPQRARPVLERALALDPELALAHEGLGSLLLRDGHTRAALDAFARAAELDSASFLAHYYHAVASLRAGDSIEAALSDLDRSIQLNPDFAPAHLLIATAVAELGSDDERGLASAMKAVELTPDDPEAHEILGRLLVASGEAEAGARSYRRALELPSQEARMFRELAFDFLELDLFDEASTALERARALEPDDAETAFTLALALSEAGRLDEAVEAFENATALAPDIARYHYRLGELLLERASYAEAASALARSLELDPDAVAVHRDLGHALLSSGRAEDAIPHLRKALEKSPRLGVLHYELATALIATGDPSDAEDHFRTAEKLGYEP